MTLTLNTQERLAALSVLPQAGNLVLLRQTREAIDKLSFSEEEQAALKMVTNAEGLTRWDKALDRETEIELSAAVFALILGEFKKLDDTGKLAMFHISCYEKFAGQ